MSEDQDIAAKRLLETLADVNHLLREHSIGLGRLSDVTSAQVFPLESVRYINGPRLEGYVEATLSGGDVVCWCIDVSWNQICWIVEGTLDRKSGDRQKTVSELPIAIANDFDGFLKELKRVASQLVELNIAG